MYRRTAGLTPLLITFFLLLGKSMVAQEVGPLTLSLETKKHHVCAGERLTLTAHLENVSDHDVAVDLNQIGYSMNIIWSHPTRRGNSIGSYNVQGDDVAATESQILVLRPGTMATKKVGVLLDQPFLHGRRFNKYFVRLAYGQFRPSSTPYTTEMLWRGVVDSNAAGLFIGDCPSRKNGVMKKRRGHTF